MKEEVLKHREERFYGENIYAIHLELDDPNFLFSYKNPMDLWLVTIF